MDLIIMGQSSKACRVTGRKKRMGLGAIKSRPFWHVPGSGSNTAASDIYCIPSGTATIV